MGCGASSLDPLDVNLNRHSNNPLRRYRVVQPIMEEPPKILLPPLPKDDIVFAFPGYTRHEEVVGVKETNNKDGHAKPPSISNIGRSESDSIDRDDAFTGPASPSFREYCIHSRDPSSMDMDHSHDDSDSGESIDNMDNDDSIVSNTKPPRKETTNPNNEHEKKERKVRKLRDVISRGRSQGKKMNFTRYRSANKSHAEGNRNRVGRLA